MAKKNRKKNDPHASREAKKYAHPIPSREYILEYLEQLGRPASLKHLISALELDKEEESEALGYRLKAMVRDGQLMIDRRGRFCLLEKLTLVRGKVQGHADGFGFLVPDDGGDDLFLSAKQMMRVMHGDVVLARKSGADRRGRQEAIIHEIIERANRTVVGRYYVEHGVGFVEPDNKRLSQDVLIPDEHVNHAKKADMVLVEILAQPTKCSRPIGRVVEILGEHMAPGMETDVAIYSHGLPNQWPEEVLESCQAFRLELTQQDYEGRNDLRQVPFVTIDGEDARDFDDAVYCKPKTKGGWQLFVAIADVSHYVDVASALDKEATKRGNSVYFPGRVIPMLPEVLSNGLCSLNPKVDRLAMVCEMSVSSKGGLSRYRFYPAVIHSHARLTYTAVAEFLDTKQAPEDWHPSIAQGLEDLHQLYKTLHKARADRGAIEFDTTETKIQFDDSKKIKTIEPLKRNDAHRLIEECMLMANVAAARFLLKNKIPALYRIHDKPSEERLNALREFLGEFALNLGGGKKPQPKDLQATLSRVGERPEKHLIETVMLRSLTQAEYTPKNIGHFGLAYKAYTHFTSPIRRYPDLLVHRAIKHLIGHHQVDDFVYDEPTIARLGKHCSMTERRADEATREVVAWLKCEYMQDKIGETYEGRIASVTSFGIFVELVDYYVEGLVHVTGLKNDYYQFDATRHRLIGERTRTIYRLGDRVKVCVVRVDLDERKIDFELADE